MGIQPNGPYLFDTTGGAAGSTIFDIMQINSSFRADYSWYLPRIDKLYLSHDGKLRVSKGVSGYYLIPPQPVANSMLLATIEYKPYVFDPERDVLITTIRPGTALTFTIVFPASKAAIFGSATAAASNSTESVPAGTVIRARSFP